MSSTNSKKTVERVIGASLVGTTALVIGAGSMPAVASPGLAPAVVMTAAQDNPNLPLGDGVTIVGPSNPYVDDSNKNKYWYTTGGTFTLEVDKKNINKVTVTLDGEEIHSKDLGADGPDTYTGTFSVNKGGVIEVTVLHGSVTPPPTDPEIDPETGEPVIDPETGEPSKPVQGPPTDPETTKVQTEVALDTDAPEVTGTVSGAITGNNKTITGDDTKFTVNLSDLGVGVKEAELEKYDTATKTWVKSRGLSDGTEFNIKVSGQYRISASDKLGNSKTYDFKNIFSTSGTIQYLSEQTGTLSYTVNGKAATGSFYKDEAVLNATIGKGWITNGSITVNGQQVWAERYKYSDTDYVVDIDLSTLPRPENGQYDVSVNVSYFNGNDVKKDFTINADFDAPTLSNAKIEGDYLLDGGVIYTSGGVRVSVDANDIGSGVKEVTVDGATVKVSESGSNYSFDAVTGKDYKFTVTDGVGHKTTKSLTDLGLPSNNIVVDNKAPVNAEVNAPKPGYVAGDKDWYTKAGKSTWSVKDDNLSSVDIDVNGEVENFAPSANGEYSVDLSKYALADGNRLTVTVTSTDKAGNVTKSTKVLYIDGDAPRDIQANVEGVYQDRSFGVYAVDPLTFHSTSNDGSGVGVKTYELIDGNGNVVKEFKSGEVVLPSGEFRLVVVDLLGNKSEPKTLKELLGTKTNRFIYDATAPKISVDRNNPAYKNWYGSDVEYKINISDNEALYSARVVVNGKDLDAFTSNKVETNRSLSFNTKDVPANEDGSYDIIVNAIDAAGNTVSWSETIKIDRDAPEIKSFTFTTPGFKEGQSLSKSKDYGFFFKDATSVDIKVSDKAPSAGVKEISYVLRSDNGSIFKTGKAPVDGDTARVSIPVGFKGFIDANATDNVSHTGATQHPSGVITENRNWYVNTSDIQINLSDPGHRDHKNQYLYKGDTLATVPIKQGVSGIKQVEWGIGTTTLGTANVGIDGSLTGAGFGVDERNQNLVLRSTGRLPIQGNTNDMKIWVKVTDRAGYTSNADKTVSIDKDAPVVDVTYNQTNKSSYYNSNRVATVTIKERNFNPNDVKWTGKYGSLSNWQNVGGDTWRATITFAEETQYEWGVSYTDMAGNVGNSYSSEQFTVDKTAPRLTVTFNNNSVQNKKFYKAARTANIEVIDRNFDPSKVAYSGDGKISGWSSNGDRHVASVSFAKDGVYKFNVSATDKAENKSNAYDSGEFIVDTTKPKLEITGVKQGVSYKKDAGFKVSASDQYLSPANSVVTLVGRKNGKIEVKGGFNPKTGLFELANFPEGKKYDDFYTLNAKVTDQAGNEDIKKVSFSVNRHGSTFDFVNGDFNGQYFQKLPNDITLVQTSVDRLDMDKFRVVVLRNGQPVDVPERYWNVTESGGEKSDWVYTLTVNKDMFTEDGAYQVQMFSQAKDGSKESSMAQEYAFVIDHTPPVVYISGVESNKVYKALSKDVTVEVRDLSGVEEIAILLNGEPVQYTQESGVYKFSIPANSKSNDVTVEVKDKAGNNSQSEVLDVYLTSSQLEVLWHNDWVKWLTGAVALIVLGVIYLLTLGAVKRRREDKAKQANLDAAQAASAGIATGGSSSLGVAGDAPTADPDEHIVASGGAHAAIPEPSGAAEDDIATDHLVEGDESTNILDEGDEGTQILGDDTK